MTKPNPSPGFLLSSTSNPRSGLERRPACLSRVAFGNKVAPPSSSRPVLIQSLGSMVRVTGTDSRKLVLWMREERAGGAGEGGVLVEVRGTGSVSGSREEDSAGGAGGCS